MNSPRFKIFIFLAPSQKFDQHWWENYQICQRYFKPYFDILSSNKEHNGRHNSTCRVNPL